MNRSKSIFFYYTLRNKNRILEVVAIPRHKRDAHVLPQCKFTHVDRRAISKNVAASNCITFSDQRPLRNTGVLIRTGILSQVVDIYTCFTGICFFIINSNNNSRRIYRFDYTATECNNTYARVSRNITLHSCTN